jgi:hypothetical protein
MPVPKASRAFLVGNRHSNAIFSVSTNVFLGHSMDTRCSLYLKRAMLSGALAGCLVSGAMADEPAARPETPPAASVVSRPEPRLVESQAADKSAAESRAAEQARSASESRAPQKRARPRRAASREPGQQSGIDHFYY